VLHVHLHHVCSDAAGTAPLLLLIQHLLLEELLLNNRRWDRHLLLGENLWGEASLQPSVAAARPLGRSSLDVFSWPRVETVRLPRRWLQWQ